MEDFAAALEAHSCTKGICRKNTHQQVVPLVAADVSTVTAEIATLVLVRDVLRDHDFQWLEGEPTPRFEPGESAAKPWTIRFEQLWARPGAGGPSGAKRGWLSRLWTPAG